MKLARPRRFALLLWLVLAPLLWLVLASTAEAQQDGSNIGYVYPAGGRRGTTFEMLVGGRDLDGVVAARVSGEGVKVEIVEHIRPLNQGQFKEMQNRMGELKKKRMAAAGDSFRRGRRGASRPFTNENWTAEEDKELAEIRKRLATFSIRRSSVPALVETLTLRVMVAQTAEPGDRELRLQTEAGLSNPLVFRVDQLPEITEESARSVAVSRSQHRGGRGRKRQQSARPDPGTTPTSTQPEVETDVTLPAMLNGQILPGDVDRYRFRAKKGCQLVVDVRARKLIPYLSDAVPGWFQATVALFDADGKEIAYDDDFRFHPDPVLHCEIPESGEYVLEIRDALYRGREDFVYRVAIGELPYVTAVFPLGTRADTPTSVELSGWNLRDTTLLIPPLEPGRTSISTRAGRLVSNRVPFAVDGLPEQTESEPNDEPTTGEEVAFPVIVNGRIDRPGDVDVFRVELHKGDRIVAEVRARRLGSPLDSILKLTGSGGEQLALNDDYEDRGAGLTTHHADSRLRVTIPADGVYHLHLTDTRRKGGPEYAYRLHIRKDTPDFALRVVPSSVNARAGTTVPITVHALRESGFSGEIALTLVDPSPVDSPPGFVLRGGRIPAGCDGVRMTLTVPAESSEEPRTLTLKGRATIAGREIIRPAVAADDRMQAFIYRHLVPAETLQVAVVGSPRRSTMDVLTGETVRIPSDGTVHVPIDVPRRSFFGAIQLELSDPPKGVTIDEVVLGRRRSELVLRCDGAEPGLKGNLIVNVFAAKTRKDSGKGKEQRKKRRILLSTLPAIPFEIVGN